MPTYKLTYFNVRARAEVIRMALSAAGQEFEDVRITREEWPDMKKTTPLGQLPILEIDGKPMIQSTAIARHLARVYDLYGSGNMEMACVDVVMETVDDAILAAARAFFEADETKKAELKKNLKENFLPKFVPFLCEILKKSGKGWMVGSKVTIADFAVYNIMEFIIGTTYPDKTVEEFLKDRPELLAHRLKVKECKGVCDYLAKRPVTNL